MNVAIIHYHLNRGGVTRVIANHLLALDTQVDAGTRVALLFGGRDAGGPHELADRLSSIELSLHAIPALDYDEERPTVDSDSLAEELQTALAPLSFQPHDTLLHVHNHSLGKNSALPGALRRLAENRFRLLLQIHDFAEDFRPLNYRRLTETFGPEGVAAALYPQAPQIHYAVLNRRDLGVLRTAGVPAERLHFLPNPVPPPVPAGSPAAAEQPGCSDAPRQRARQKLHERFGVGPSQRFALYPVRGIRRKNIGEALLWSLLADEGTVTGLTLAPLNPAEQTEYHRWRKLAAELKAPFLFETGEAGGLTFQENLAAADLILTTSLAEGYGMVYLESWLAGRALTGRNLPEITVDFTDAGLEFPGLYDRLEVPIEWIGRRRFADAFQSALSGVMQSYGRPSIALPLLDDVLARKIDDGLVDFGDLNEELQEQVVRRVAADAAARRRIIERNPSVRSSVSGGAELIADNRRLIETSFSLEPSGRRLHDIYRALLTETAGGGNPFPLPAPARILDEFLNPDRYRMIRG